MLIKRIFLFIFFSNVALFIFSEYLILKDGTIFSGKLLSLNKDNILMEINSKFLEFSFNSIDLFIHNNIQDKDLIINIEKKDASKEKINLIKAASNALFYKIRNNNDINMILISNIKSMKKNNQSSNKMKIEKYRMQLMDDINADIDNLIERLKNKGNTNKGLNDNDIKNDYDTAYVFLNINDLDFYEKFWGKINNYTNDCTKTLLWNLYELYSNKEKYLNLIYSNDIIESNYINNYSLQNADNNISKNEDINDKFIILRNEFFYRAKRIIYNSEFLTN